MSGLWAVLHRVGRSLDGCLPHHLLRMQMRPRGCFDLKNRVEKSDPQRLDCLHFPDQRWGVVL